MRYSQSAKGRTVVDFSRVVARMVDEGLRREGHAYQRPIPGERER